MQKCWIKENRHPLAPHSSSSSSSSIDEYYLGGTTIALLLQDHRTMSTTGSL